MKRILLDMDGVIADFHGAAAHLFGKNPATAKGWNFWEPWGIGPKAFWSALTYDFWAGMAPTVEAWSIVSACTATAGVENVSLLSSPCDTFGCMEGKRRWVREHFPQFNRRFLFGPAKEFCSHGAVLLIDDYDKNVDLFRAEGGKAFLFPRPWNAAAAQEEDAIPLLKAELSALFPSPRHNAA